MTIIINEGLISNLELNALNEKETDIQNNPNMYMNFEEERVRVFEIINKNDIKA